jgi:hypothetical protein
VSLHAPLFSRAHRPSSQLLNAACAACAASPGAAVPAGRAASWVHRLVTCQNHLAACSAPTPRMPAPELRVSRHISILGGRRAGGGLHGAGAGACTQLCFLPLRSAASARRFSMISPPPRPIHAPLNTSYRVHAVPLAHVRRPSADLGDDDLPRAPARVPERAARLPASVWVGKRPEMAVGCQQAHMCTLRACPMGAPCLANS